jgi:4-aminobutyrate aminotransferase-like enzyme
VRGVGLMAGVEIVYDTETRKPAKELAEKISYM